MKKYTDLEQKQIDELCSILKDKKNTEKLKIHDIDNITDKMIYHLHYDERVNGVYGKKDITIGALKHIFINNNSDDKLNYSHEKIIDNYEKNIDMKLNQIEFNKIKEEQKKCCRGCIIC